MRASNLLWGLGQPSSDLVGLTKILVGRTRIFGQANQKIMRLKETKFLDSAIKIFGWGYQIFGQPEKLESSIHWILFFLLINQKKNVWLKEEKNSMDPGFKFFWV